MPFFESCSFCSYVIVTQSARCRSGSKLLTVLLPFRKYFLLRVHSFVFLLPDTLTCSQDLMAKKKAPMNSSQRALPAGEMDIW